MRDNYWWLRSVYAGNSNRAVNVNNNGTPNYNRVDNDYMVPL